MFCHKCGSKSLEGAVFCQKCGAKLIRGEAMEQSSVESALNTVPQAVEHTSETPAIPVPTAVPEPVETPTVMAEVGKDRNEVTIHGYSKIGNFDRKIKVFRNGELVGKVGQGETIVVPNNTDGTFLFKCSPMKAQYTVKAGNGELQLEWDLSRLKVFDLSSGKPLEKLEQIRKNNKKWVMAGSILMGICAIVMLITMLIGFFMSDGANHVELVRYFSPFEDAGITATCEMVIDKYFTSPKWKERKGSDSIWYVDVNGKMAMNGEAIKNVTLTFKVTPEGNKYLAHTFMIEAYGIDIDGQSGNAEQASSFITALFDAYSQNYESMESYELTTSSAETDSGDTLLNYDDAYNIAKAWLDAHPAMATPYEPTTIKEASDVMFVHNGEEYYRFYLNGYHWLDILVNSKTGELLCAVHEESDEPTPPEILRLDDYYNKYFNDVQPASSGEVLYKGIPVSSFFDTLAEDVASTLGFPAGADRDDDIRLYIVHERAEVESVEVWTPSALTVNGVTLNKNREGLISIFGSPIEEGNGGSGYFMRYHLPECSMSFELGEPDSEAWRIWITPSANTYIDGQFEWVTMPEAKDIYISNVRMGCAIQGTIKNITNTTFSHVSIAFSLYDSSGNQIGDTSDYISNFIGGNTWKFEATILNGNPARFEFAGITAW